jgi:hypothetical protein
MGMHVNPAFININEMKRKKKSDINALYLLHVRLQEEASPNQPQLSKISRLL